MKELLNGLENNDLEDWTEVIIIFKSPYLGKTQSKTLTHLRNKIWDNVIKLNAMYF